MNNADDMPSGVTAQPYVILSLKWSRGPILTWWQPGNSGYTTLLDKAGLYDASEIAARPDYYNNERETLAIPYQQALLMVRQVVLRDTLQQTLGRPFWMTDTGLRLTKPEPEVCEVCEVAGCSGYGHSTEEQERAWQNRNPR